MARIGHSVVQLEGLFGQVRFSLGDRDVTVEYRRPFLRRRASYAFETIDRNPGLEVRPFWLYAVAAGALFVAAVLFFTLGQNGKVPKPFVYGSVRPGASACVERSTQTKERSGEKRHWSDREV